MLTVAVAVAAGLGAVARYLVTSAVQARTDGPFPYGTLVVNVSGCLLVGLLLGRAATAGLPAEVVAVVGTGFAGGFTTLSTFAYESLALARGARALAAAANVVGSTVLGLLATATGTALGAGLPV